MKDAPIADKDVPSSSGQSSLEEEILDDSEDDLEDTGEGLSNREQFKNRDIKRENNLEEVKSSTDNRDEEDSLFNFPGTSFGWLYIQNRIKIFSDTSTSQLDFCSTAFTEDDSFPGDYVTLSICPKNTDLSFDLRDRLPPELSELFPELEATCMLFWLLFFFKISNLFFSNSSTKQKHKMQNDSPCACMYPKVIYTGGGNAKMARYDSCVERRLIYYCSLNKYLNYLKLPLMFDIKFSNKSWLSLLPVQRV